VKRIPGYFFQGLLLIAPVGITLFILWKALSWLDELVQLDYPGLGLLIIISGITLLGFLSSTFLVKPIFNLTERLLNTVPFVKLVYSSLKDLFSAFVGEKKTFTQVVKITLFKDSEISKIGFITQNDLEKLGLGGLIAVYVPHSYNFSGDMFLVPANLVTPLNIAPADAMKMVVSGGIALSDNNRKTSDSNS
jgi:uncharacterized membrane protein